MRKIKEFLYKYLLVESSYKDISLFYLIKEYGFFIGMEKKYPNMKIYFPTLVLVISIINLIVVCKLN